ncbi:SH3 and multiple ankyrin repeat domains protein 1-like, partial [Amphibalanus amphitrite]|uniref:SH3 and multiple ankyrin repeat domains protein 1-like n=1 Tax=Amphibalanus amphitrite TaxID=1232801 RepID=UPI001C919571
GRDMNVVMDDYNRKLEGYEMRRLQRMGPSGASLTHTGSARELQHMGSSLSSNQPSNASSPPTLRISPAGLPALHKGAIPPAHRHHHRPHSRSSAPDTTNGFGTRLQRMGSSTTDSPSPQPQTFVSSMTVPVGAYRPAPAHGGSALQLAGLPPGPAVHRAGSHGRLEGAPASIRGGHEPPREMREPRGSRPSRAGSQSSRAGSQSVLTRMESGESEPPATSRSASTSHLPLRSTSISSLNSSESYPSQEQQSHFSLRSAHSHHSVRSLGGASQQLSLSALLPQPGMSPPLDDWGADRESPLSGAGFWRCIMACHSKVGQQIARKR